MAEDPIDREAPGDLEVVRSFVDTLDVEEGTDSLSTPAAASAWLEGLGRPGRLTRRELEELVELRDALRDLLVARGTSAEPDTVAKVDRIARRHPLVVRLSSATPLGGDPSASGSELAAEILGIVAAATIDGSWDRLKLCANDECRWAYYDHSRNRSRTWCAMESCGSQAKMRAYRRRRAAARNA